MTNSSYPNPTWRYWWGTVDMVVAHYGNDHSQFTNQLKTLLSRIGSTTENSWQSHGKWVFAACKVYNSNQIANIDSQLLAMAGLSLRINLKAGLSWSIALFANGQEQYTYRHDFSFLHPRLLTETQINNLAKAYDGDFHAYIEDYELDIPANLQAAWQNLSFREFHLHCIDWYRQTCLDKADRIADLFQEYSVECDRSHLAEVLTAKACTESELEWYVGNLPRFLTAIGLGEVFWNWETELLQYL